MFSAVRRHISKLLNSEEEEAQAEVHAADAHEAECTRSSSPPIKTATPAIMASAVQYYPPQMDPHAGTSTRALREGPIWLLLQDAGVLLKMLRYMPNIVLPIKAASPDDELATNAAGTWETFVQAFLIIFEVVLLLVTPIGIIMSPGLLFIPVLFLAYGIIWLICWPLHGPDICFSNMDAETAALAQTHTDERWVFVNGCATNHAGLQKNIDRLAKTFGREVIGIHNKSFGLVADILECLIQRCFAYKTQDVRTAYFGLKPFLKSSSVKKVVLVGHSQGGLIISLVLDQLFTELPGENMAKLEIYTFGSAASHFSNPSVKLSTEADPLSLNRTIQSDRPSISPQGQHVIGHIEHYANEYDVIPRWGVLHSICDIQTNRYAGSVFVRMHQSGHMFNQHYMDAMFPLPEQTSASPMVHFLDRAVSTDLELAWKHAVIPAAEVSGILRRATTGLEFGTGDRMLPKDEGLPSIGFNVMQSSSAAASSNAPVMAFSRTTSGAVVGEETSGKSVRELSRLWRYLGGKSPDE